MLDDLFVIKKIKEGDIVTFEKVFRAYYTPLCIYSSSISGRLDISEEIVQELFYVLWRDRETLQVFRSLKNYLYGAVRNRSLQYMEHREVQNKHRETTLKKGEISGSTPEENLEYKEFEEIIEETLARMPERQSRIFRMHRFENKKYSEIAESLSVSVKTVEAEMTKALRELRKNIERYTKIL